MNHSISPAQESIPPEEPQAIEEAVVLLTEMVRRLTAKSGRARRDAHAKSHGCVRGRFIIDGELEEPFRRGVFHPGTEYPCWIRYSNGNELIRRDSTGDGRGMAIKLCGVPGRKLMDDEKKTQDFLLINHPNFFFETAAEFVAFQRVNSMGRPHLFLFPTLNPKTWRLRELRVIAAITSKRITNPFALQYWSMTPYLYGEGMAAKFSVRPSHSFREFSGNRASPDFLREVMKGQLAQGEVELEFLVQRQTDPASMPIEDPIQEWLPSQSPFVKVATIYIPTQDFISVAQDKFSENLSFSPWHGLFEHRPLGGINRVRKVVYEVISKLRHELNNEERFEPDGMETFTCGD